MNAPYLVCGGQHPDTDDEVFQTLLADHYHNRKNEQPRCLCQDPGVPLYIAKVGDRYLLKRWPNSGAKHRYTCEKYEPPMEASGIGSLMGGAIKEEPLTGMTSLAVDFSLKKIRRAESVAGATEPKDAGADDDKTSAGSESRKLTLKSILHYLWDKSEFCRWTPNMQDRRNWAVISAYLSQTAQTLQVKQLALPQLLYIPPVWNQAEGERQSTRRQSFFAAFQTRSGPKRLVMVLGEVKAIDRSQYGHRLVLKSMGDTRIYLSETKHAELLKRFGFEVASWRQHGDPTDNGKPHHLVVLFTAAVTETGALQVEDLTLMIVTPHWLPYFSLHDGLVITTAVALKRRFLKPMTYNLGKGRTLPTVIFVDTRPLQVNLFIKTPVDTEILSRCRDELVAASKGHSLVWATDGGESVWDVIERLKS